MKSDPFSILGLEARFEVSAGEVERAYLARAAGLHPDLAGGGGEEAAALNEAKEVLLNSEARAGALLRVLGGAEDKSLPVGFLARLMEAREAVEAGEDRARWRAWALEQRGEFERVVGGLFARGELGTVRTQLNAWRYVERMIEQMEHP